MQYAAKLGCLKHIVASHEAAAVLTACGRVIRITSTAYGWMLDKAARKLDVCKACRRRALAETKTRRPKL